MNEPYTLLLRNIRLPAAAEEAEILAAAGQRVLAAGLRPLSVSLHKRSVDARSRRSGGGLQIVCSAAVEIALPEGTKPAELLSPALLARLDAVRILPPALELHFGSQPLEGRPVVVGFGPCGMFAALLLAEQGFRPLVLERGGSVEEREKAVDLFCRTGLLQSECNLQFGAGGAGTFSDGKCVTRVNDSLCRYVLARLVEFGAPENLLTLAKPHIGTDRLRQVVTNFDRRIRALGGEILYHTKLLSLSCRGGRVTGLHTNRGDVPCGALLLAVGHSARDTWQALSKDGLTLLPKDFSVGVRIEHLQSDIDRALYGPAADTAKLGHGEYALSMHGRDGRGVYTFCMCPGGEVAAAASEEGGVVVNGMSRYARDGRNANCALAVTVRREDYGDSPAAAVEFQRKIERAAFQTAGGDYFAPLQTVGNFLAGKAGGEPTVVLPTYRQTGKVRPADFSKIFPPFVLEGLRQALPVFGRQIAGFAAPFALLTAPETRTSSPVRVLREAESLTAPGFSNLYPGGEGAGYAGGITSAALDGIRLATALFRRYRRPA